MDTPDSPSNKDKSLSGMRAFYLLWVGQFVSIFATRMTNFAISLWAWDLTGNVTGFVLVGVISYLPSVFLSPFAGTLIDRWNRKLVLALSDAGAAISTAVLLYLFLTDQAEIWHLYATGAFTNIFGVFQYPAYSSVVTTMVPKDQFARANGMQSVVRSASGIAAPLLAGVLLTVIDLPTIMIIDLITFFFALSTLFLIIIPQPEQSKESLAGKGSIWKETLHGFRYVLDRKSLTAIFLLFAFSNIGAAFVYPLMTPMILAKTGDSSLILGMSRSASSVGFLAGGLLMSLWGGPKKRIHAVNLTFILQGMVATFLFGPAWSIPMWLIGSFLISSANPIINSAYIAILQSKVEPDLQGRLFGIENAITTITYPLGQLLAGYLADSIFEPGITSGSLNSVFGSVFGVNAGAGIGAVIAIGGLIGIIKGFAGYIIKPVREIETILPDHGIAEEATA